MFGWFVVALVVLLGLFVLAALARRRPRTADELLGQAAVPPETRLTAPADAAQSVREVVRGLVAKRATGLLTVRKGDQVCSVSILFGHIFDAECGAVQGEDALLPAMNWTDARCGFDPTAKLTTNESITTPTRSLLESRAPDPPLPSA